MTSPQMELPPITLMRNDLDKLVRLANAAEGRFAQIGEFLAREIDRAKVVEGSEPQPGLVAMGTRVTFRDNVTGQERTITLVYPEEADLAQNRISVLTPIGAALIGLFVGHSIEWRTVEGETRSLTILAVEPAA